LALAAREADVPFYACVPSSSIDWTIEDGLAHIPIEERSASEVLEPGGRAIAPQGTRAFNPAFDVTPARLVTGIVSEHGLFPATLGALDGLRVIAERERASAASVEGRRDR
jgi:methylthioribose-1-phosphate isomerase